MTIQSINPRSTFQIAEKIAYQDEEAYVKTNVWAIWPPLFSYCIPRQNCTFAQQQARLQRFIQFLFDKVKKYYTALEFACPMCKVFRLPRRELTERLYRSLEDVYLFIQPFPDKLDAPARTVVMTFSKASEICWTFYKIACLNHGT